MPVWFLFVIYVLAVYRVTRFFVADTLGEELKDKMFDFLVGRVPAKLLDEVQYLLSCYWCLSIWVSAWFTGLGLFFVDVPVPFLWWLAVSSVVGLMSLFDRE